MSTMAKEITPKNDNKIPILRHVLYLITYRCNLRCKHCFYWSPSVARLTSANNQGNELSTSEVEELVLQSLAMMNAHSLTISGGEPLMRQDIFDVLRLAERFQLNYQLQSNLTLRVPQLLKVLPSLKRLKIQVSLDGPPESHDEIRGKGMFQTTFNALKKIGDLRRALGFPHSGISVNCVIGKHNIANFSELVSLIVNANVKVDAISFQLLSWAPLDNKVDNITAQFKVEKQYQVNSNYQFAHYPNRADITETETFQAYEQAQRAIRLAEDNGLKLVFFPVGPELWPSMLRKWFNTFEVLCWRGCSSIFHRARIDPFGNVFPCLEIPMGNVRNKALGEIWNNKKYHQFRYLISNHGPARGCRRCCNLEGCAAQYGF